MSLRAAGDLHEEAAAAGQRVATRLGVTASEPVMLHRSNNVLLRFGDVVFKIGLDAALVREASVAAYVADRSGPVLAPVAGPVVDGEFTVTAWPYIPPAPDRGDEVAAACLSELHEALVGTPAHLPTLSEALRRVGEVLDDRDATNALAPTDRRLLQGALERVLPSAAADDPIVLHGEPHSGNRLTVDDRVVYIDLEGVRLGPAEWDMAFFPEHVVTRTWPDHDAERLRRMRVAVSVTVSTYCWRHVSARPADDAVRWHAQHHLDYVRRHTDKL